MAKNKKRKKNNSTRSIQQIHAARYKNEVMEQLAYLCYLIDGIELFNLIPQQYKDAIYCTRGALRIVSGYGKKIQRRLAEVMEKGLRKEMSRHTIEVVKGSGKMMLLDNFLTVGVSLYILLTDEKCFFRGKERFAPFYRDNHNMRDLFIREVEKYIPLYCDFYSDLKRNVLYDFWTKTKLYYPLPGETVAGRFTLQVVIEPFELEVKHFRINSETHLGTKLMCIEHDPERKAKSGYDENTKFTLSYEVCVNHKHLDPKSGFPDLPVCVYIQKHAVDRLMERTWCPFPNWIHSCLAKAMFDPKVVRLPDNRFLFEYHIVGIKIGYLLATLVDGALLIRTFLFITNSGTPEGRRLEELTGLQKEDKKYLSIDNLRALANSDIEQNETVHDIFLRAGFGSILELCKRVRERDRNFSWLINHSENQTSLSHLITEYLKPGADNDEFVEIEDD
ncbi:MAG: hypothetical protein LBL07_15815 [Tannerella sp.]|jgi:hypothetical protein|nr:hypothetical protein [Tannerella sp.]